MKFKLHAPYKPSGDQPKAVKSLVLGLEKNMPRQTLLGVTGSGKTFTIANVIQQVQKPTLVIAHNKTLAAQLCNEFREFFPENAVEYFVSYYDYYQPEAYIPGSDTYIEKEAQVNEEIDRLRHACTQALLSRRDVIIVASVSCIYGLGSPKEYERIVLHLERGQKLDRRGMLEQLIDMQFERTNAELTRGSFRMRGQTFEIMPVSEEKIYRFEIDEQIRSIELVDPVRRNVIRELADAWFFPAKHYVAPKEARVAAIASIRAELKERLAFFKKHGKVLEYERLKRRVAYDMEMMQNIGYCNGIENYSRHFDGRAQGRPPFTLLDFFMHGVGKDEAVAGAGKFGAGKSAADAKKTDAKKNAGGDFSKLDFLTIIDESHVTVPQIGAMYLGDRARKETLADHGFRLPSAKDNRPLTFDEFYERARNIIFVSATPNQFEIKESKNVAEQIVRPTGLIDPQIDVRPVTGKGKKLSQVDDVIAEIQKTIKKKERVLVTTLTKKMAEDLAEFLEERGIKLAYLHSDIHTLERVDIISRLRRGDIDVIVGVNLLREGLDIPEVSLVAILDADKEGFLRSETSLVQTIGRAARNVDGRVIMYADTVTGSIKRAIKETDRRRAIQLAYNKKHGITPTTIQKSIRNILEEFGISKDSVGGDVRGRKGRGKGAGKKDRAGGQAGRGEYAGGPGTGNGRESVLDLDMLGDARDINTIIKDKEAQMKRAAQELEFELAAVLRDEVRELLARVKAHESGGKRKTKIGRSKKTASETSVRRAGRK